MQPSNQIHLARIACGVLASLLIFSCAKDRKAVLVPPVGKVRYLATNDSLRPLLIYADDQTSRNGSCIVRMAKLNKRMPPIYVNGQPIGFCWTPCVKVFVQDPSPYLNNHELSFMCAVREGRPAMIDSTHWRRVNYELFFFSNSAAIAAFEKDPIAHCGILTDPISRVRFRPGDDSPKLVYKDKPFYFWSDSTRNLFQMMPDMYLLPDYGMLPPDSSQIL